MNFYYGLVDPDNNAWGFIEETDSRVTSDMVKLTRDEWAALLEGQSSGQMIAYYEGKVFNAERGKYYVDEEGWHEKSDEEFNTEKAEERRTNLVNEIYNIKAERAYGGVTVNDTLVFETNQTAITNTVASLALMDDDDTTSWKFYTSDGEPSTQSVTKTQLATIAKFGQKMINACFEVEGTYNTKIAEATEDELLDDDWIASFKEEAQEAMDAITNTITVEF